MPNQHLTAIKSEDGFIFICPKCQVRGIAVVGTSDEVRPHLLICPVCRTTLGAWLTSEKREWALAELSKKLERSFARGPSGSRKEVAHRISISRFLQLSEAYLLRRAEQIAVVTRKIRDWRTLGSGVNE